MTGTLPATALLLTHHGVVEGHFDSYLAVAQHIGFTVTDQGVVMLGEKEHHPHYIYDPKGLDRNAFHSKVEVLRDWARCYMKLPGYGLYRYLT